MKKKSYCPRNMNKMWRVYLLFVSWYYTFHFRYWFKEVEWVKGSARQECHRQSNLSSLHTSCWVVQPIVKQIDVWTHTTQMRGLSIWQSYLTNPLPMSVFLSFKRCTRCKFYNPNSILVPHNPLPFLHCTSYLIRLLSSSLCNRFILHT